MTTWRKSYDQKFIYLSMYFFIIYSEKLALELKIIKCSTKWGVLRFSYDKGYIKR